MLNEIKTFIENVKHFRQILKEGVGDSVIVNAINQHKYLYIYYAGDNTTLKGYRTIKPFVLGTSTAGNKVLRAWQEAGSSDSYAGLTGRKREDHEYFYTKDGIRIERKIENLPAKLKNNPGATKAWLAGEKEIFTEKSMKPGWRLFRVDGITSALPTGKQFGVDENHIPPLYNPDDKQMTSIIAAVQVGKEDGETKTDGLDSITKPDNVQQSVDKSFFKTQAPKFQQFYKAATKQREATKEEIESLYNVAVRVRKKSPNNLNVVYNQGGDMVLKDVKDPNVPQDSIVGNLKDLYTKFVNPQSVSNNSFLKRSSETSKKQADQNIQEKKNLFR